MPVIVDFVLAKVVSQHGILVKLIDHGKLTG